MKYAGPYLVDGFLGDNVDAQVLLELATMTTISFGGGTDRSGGFVQPDLPIRGLSRSLGLLGDQDLVTNPTAGAGFDPAKFLDGVFPKLFGLFSLVDILEAVGLDAAPKFVTDQLDKISSMLRDLDALRTSLQRAVDRLGADAASAATTKLRQQAQDAANDIEAIRAGFAAQLQSLKDTVDALLGLDDPSDVTTVTAAVSGLLGAIAGFVTNLQQVVATSPLPSAVRAELERLTNALAPLLDAAEVVKTIAGIVDFVNGFDPSELAVKASFEWRPEMSNFPAGTTEDDALFFVRPDGFVLAVEARASGSDGVGFDALAELSDFGLNLFPGEPLIKLRFDRLGFRASSGRKAEVDVVFNGLEFVRCAQLHRDAAGADPLRRLLRPALRGRQHRRRHGRLRPGPSQRRRRRVQAVEHLARRRRPGAVPRRGDERRVQLLHPRASVRSDGHLHRWRRILRIRLSPKGLEVLEMGWRPAPPCRRPRGRVGFGLGVGRRVHAPRGREGLAHRLLPAPRRGRRARPDLGVDRAVPSLGYEFDTGKLVGRAG